MRIGGPINRRVASMTLAFKTPDVIRLNSSPTAAKLHLRIYEGPEIATYGAGDLRVTVIERPEA